MILEVICEIKATWDCLSSIGTRSAFLHLFGEWEGILLYLPLRDEAVFSTGFRGWTSVTIQLARKVTWHILGSKLVS